RSMEGRVRIVIVRHLSRLEEPVLAEPVPREHLAEVGDQQDIDHAVPVVEDLGTDLKLPQIPLDPVVLGKKALNVEVAENGAGGPDPAAGMSGITFRESGPISPKTVSEGFEIGSALDQDFHIQLDPIAEAPHFQDPWVNP